MEAISVLSNFSSNYNISGTICFKETNRGLQVKVNVNGLSPGKHGFHIHESGDLSKGCTSLCSHYNPTNSVHGGRNSKNRHLGDLGNIIADKNGVVNTMMYDNHLSLSDKYNIVGRSVIIHEDEDDLGLGGLKNGKVINNKIREDSLKTGSAGKRIACGVIGIKI